jgi:glutathione S-transferase
MTRTLLVLPYSPWSERARWVLLHHGLAFEERAHVPLLGELALRIRARRPFGFVSVPLLVDDGIAVMDSFAIAEHVDGIGHGDKLLPEAARDEIRALNARIEPLFDAARARSVRSLLKDDQHALAIAPSVIRRLPFAVAVTRVGSRFVARKHRTSFDDPDARMRAGLQAIRSALGGRDYVRDGFSYADIVAATALQFVHAVPDRYIPIDPSLRASWAHPELAAEFADLLAWRDAVYAKHRPVR